MMGLGSTETPPSVTEAGQRSHRQWACKALLFHLMLGFGVPLKLSFAFSKAPRGNHGMPGKPGVPIKQPVHPKVLTERWIPTLSVPLSSPNHSPTGRPLTSSLMPQLQVQGPYMEARGGRDKSRQAKVMLPDPCRLTCSVMETLWRFSST